ncbi:hypothetical protein B484DRAFT_401173 [Ochromonadaceae sp. CCMP2298]|nr:hypothetical protein B484DRAFT_401173 [Ochromonadaceae sp. CCMP2298]
MSASSANDSFESEDNGHGLSTSAPAGQMFGDLANISNEDGGDSGEAVDSGDGFHMLREDALDHITDFGWLKDCVVYDEIEEMVRNSVGGGVNRNKLRNRFIISLYHLCCNLAWQEVASNETRTDKTSLMKLLATAFDGVLANYHLKAYAQERLFQFFPEKNWPTDFLAYVQEPKQAWLAKHKELLHRSVSEQQQALWGSSIQSFASTSRQFLIGRLNPHWVEAADLPSGNTRSDWAKTRGTVTMTLAEKLRLVETTRAKNLETGLVEWGKTWRPPCWLSFVLAGLPAAENQGFVMDTLAMGRPGTANTTTDSMQSRQLRKAARKAGAGGGAGGDAGGGESTPAADHSFRHDLHIVHERPVLEPLSEHAFKVRKLKQQKSLLQDQMSCLREMGPRYILKLEHCQDLYLKVTDDMYLLSEVSQENAHNALMSAHELTALLTAPGEAFVPLSHSSSSSSSSSTQL